MMMLMNDNDDDDDDNDNDGDVDDDGAKAEESARLPRCRDHLPAVSQSLTDYPPLITSTLMIMMMMWLIGGDQT